MTRFHVKRIDDIKLRRAGPFAKMFVLSPFVWEQEGNLQVLVRAVNHSPIAAQKIARIYAGTSTDGLHFDMGTEPVIPPGPLEADQDGAADPTVVPHDGRLDVYYTGWNELSRTAQLMLAEGTGVEHLTKVGVSLPSTPRHRNTKEATVVQVQDGDWRLFFEYAEGGRSRVGLASGPSPTGPWSIQEPPFEARAGKWDCWHLSTGPMLLSASERPIMFYNGADKQALWKIGWVAFDATYTRVTARSDDPVIVPGPVKAPYRDIAFANSVVERGKTIWLYYSVADKDILRATLVKETH